MIKIAITGGIASGKSLVEEFFRQEGALTLDTDKVVHELLETNPEVIKKVCDLFKPADVTNSSGSINRKAVGEIVFNDKQKLKQLEDILHPEVKKVVEDFFSNNNKTELLVVSVPQLYEAKMENMFDVVILVNTDEKTRLQRLIKTRNLTEEAALIRIQSQDFGQEKTDKADYVIENNASPEKLRTDVKNLIQNILF